MAFKVKAYRAFFSYFFSKQVERSQKARSKDKNECKAMDCSQKQVLKANLHKNIRRAMLDQAKGPSSPASYISQWPHQMPLGAHGTTRYLF